MNILIFLVFPHQICTKGIIFKIFYFVSVNEYVVLLRKVLAYIDLPFIDYY